MVKIIEIVHRSPQTDTINFIINKDLTEKVYQIYIIILQLSENYAIPDYELSTTLLYDLKHKVNQLSHRVAEEFPENSTVRKMLDEINLYLN